MAEKGKGSLSEVSDVDLMLKVQAGETAALNVLYDRWNRPILQFFYHMGVDPDQAEDGMQEVFLRLLRAAKDYRPMGKFSTYLFQIAKYYWFNEREKLKRRAKPFSGLRREGGDEAGSTSVQFPDTSAGPRTRAMQEELDFRVRDAVQSLSEPLRVVFVLSAYEGLKYEEISEILEIPVGTVKSRMFKAMETLEEKLKRYV